MISPIDKIITAKSKNWNILDLSGSGLTELPREIFDLTNLKTLKLGKYRLPQKNYIKDIPKDIGKLSDLEVLDLTDNQITTLPDEISKLKKLKRLVLSSNNFANFPLSICELENLEELFIGNNYFSQLPREIQKLKKLHTLRLNSNKFKSIPDEINLLPALKHLYLYDNPIKNVPKELIGIREDVYAMVQQWFMDKDDGESFIYEAKLILVGEAEAGKTTLSEKLRDPSYPLNPTQPMTKGIVVNKWEFPYTESQMFCANIWDFGGQDIMHATHRYFLTERSLYVLVVDVRAEKTDFYYWLNTIELFSGKSPVIIVMNEKHSYRKELSNSIIERFKDTIVGIFDVNLKDNEGLEKLSVNIKKQLISLPHIGQEKMLNKWLAIRNTLQSHDKDFISFEDYERIAKRFGVNDTEQAMRIAKILHELGVILHFQNDAVLRNIIILNKSWATEAVYLVLLDKKVAQNFGKVTLDDLDRIWKYYPTSKRNDLIQLMINFLLCYEVEKNKLYIVPQLLPENPDNTNYSQNFNEPELYFQFNYPKFIPKGIISQLIVKMNKYIHENTQWKTGILLKIDDTFAEIIEDFFDRRIKIRISGKDKRNALTIIRKEINEINETFEKLETVEEIPCGCTMNHEEEKPFFMKRSVLDNYKLKNIKKIKCEVCLKDLLVLQLLDTTIGDEGYLEDINEYLKLQPEKIDEQYILNLLESENNQVEFKETFHVPVFRREDKKFLEDEYNQWINNPNKKDAAISRKKTIEDTLKTKEAEEIVIHNVIKTLVAFANSNGGELIIGIGEDKNGSPYIYGMEADLKKAGGKDAFMNTKFDRLISERIDKSFFALIEKREWVKVYGKEVWLLRVKASQQEVYCNNGKKESEPKEMFYIRREISTVELQGRELVK
ncbi:MAG TPA: COR domain-containing protein, partial [Saprospiraceae bacterium]|nr:COR domain-containing protein [Saprospiraceae bacterium]